jgi:hypothetical protein
VIRETSPISVELPSLSSATAATAAAKRTVAPSLADVIFMLVAVIVPLIGHRSFFGSDGDLARHLRLGEWMLQERALLLADNFSFTRAGDPFLPFEWGSQVVFALVHRAGGLPAVAVLAGLLIASTYALVAVFLRNRGVDPAFLMLATLLAAVNGKLHWLARPHLFTFVGVALLLFLLEGRTRRVWLFAPLFVVWANLHGGFVFGWILIGLYLVGSIGEALFGSERESWKPRVAYYAKALGVSVAACVVNPFGFNLLVHVADFVGGSTFIKRYTEEFASPDFYELEAKVFLATMLALVGALAVAGRRPTFPRLLVILACVGFALLHRRNIAIFGLVALPLAALHLDAVWRTLRVPGLARVRRVVAEGDSGSIVGLWGVPVAVAMILLALSGGVVRGATLLPSRFDPTVFPVEAVDRARAAQLEGRMYHSFIWGGYVLYAWPEQKVFIDGGTDFYGAELMSAHMAVESLLPGWREALQRWDISLVLIPPHWSLAHELSREAGWSIWHCDETSVLLRRHDSWPRGTAAIDPGRCLVANPDAPWRVLNF